MLAGTSSKGFDNMAWDIDTVHSRIEFTARHMMVSNVKGHFTSFSGEAHLDEANPANSRVNVTIDLASVTTGAEGRDNLLQPERVRSGVERCPGIWWLARERQDHHLD